MIDYIIYQKNLIVNTFFKKILIFFLTMGINCAIIRIKDVIS
nr:MAG TPA: hypothetical protein [Caudoviricetes sp.]